MKEISKSVNRLIEFCRSRRIESSDRLPSELVQIKSKNESGRSMLEMIGVLAIIGILSITGVAGYRHAIDKQSANATIQELSERAVVYSQQLLSGAELSSKGFKPENETQKGYALKLEAVNDNKFFTVKLENVPRGVCKNIISSDWYLPIAIYVNGRSYDEYQGNCPIKENDMSFYFDRDLNETDLAEMSGMVSGGWYPEETAPYLCQSNWDCTWSNQGPVCNKDTGECTACRSNLDCENNYRGTICDKESGLCRRCGADSDCIGNENGEFCNTDTGRCSKCVKDEHCTYDPNQPFCHKERGVCGECVVDKNCSEVKEGTACDNTTLKCIPMPQATVKDKDGNEYPCDSDKVINVNGIEDNCKNCPNRTLLDGYLCVKPCRDGEFLESIGGGRARCSDCNLRGGWTTTPTWSSCRVCKNRFTYEPSWGAGPHCELRDCGTGYVSGYSGCSKCDSLSSIFLGTWFSGGGLTPEGVKDCSQCGGDYAREVVGKYHCRLKTCPKGYFRYNNDCVSCTDSGSYDVSNATNKTACLSCTNEAGEKIRVLNDKFCVLKTKCPPESSGIVTGKDGYLHCGQCKAGYFPYGDKCIPCEDRSYYAVSAETCKLCDGTKFPRFIGYVTAGTGLGSGPVCLRKKTKDEFYSDYGTQLCTFEKTTVNYGNHKDCCACGDARYLEGNDENGGYYCYKNTHCPSNTLISGNKCMPCDTKKTIGISQIFKCGEDGTIKGTSRQDCSTVCPGQRYTYKDGSCAKCPDGKYSIGPDARSCEGTCPQSLEGLSEGVCRACGGTWENGACSK